MSYLYHLFQEIYGADNLILKAARFEALSCLRSKQLEKRVLGLKKIVFEDLALDKVPAFGELPAIIEELEDKAADILALKTMEESIEQKINLKLRKRHDAFRKGKYLLARKLSMRSSRAIA